MSDYAWLPRRASQILVHVLWLGCKNAVRSTKASGESLYVKSISFVKDGGRITALARRRAFPGRARMTTDIYEIEEDQELTRTEKLRIAARVLIKRGVAGNGGRWGLQSRLAEHFGVTRQRVSQIVRQELNSLNADSR